MIILKPRVFHAMTKNNQVQQHWKNYLSVFFTDPEQNRLRNFVAFVFDSIIPPLVFGFSQ